MAGSRYGQNGKMPEEDEGVQRTGVRHLPDGWHRAFVPGRTNPAFFGMAGPGILSVSMRYPAVSARRMPLAVRTTRFSATRSLQRPCTGSAGTKRNNRGCKIKDPARHPDVWRDLAGHIRRRGRDSNFLYIYLIILSIFILISANGTHKGAQVV